MNSTFEIEVVSGVYATPQEMNPMESTYTSAEKSKCNSSIDEKGLIKDQLQFRRLKIKFRGLSSLRISVLD